MAAELAVLLTVPAQYWRRMADCLCPLTESADTPPDTPKELQCTISVVSNSNRTVIIVKSKRDWGADEELVAWGDNLVHAE